MCRTAGEHVLKCSIPQLRLYMGNYYLKTYLSEPPGGEVFQVLDKICPFEVVMHGNNRQFQFSPYACAYIEHFTWNVKSKNLKIVKE
jgi:lipopolysaccharide transport system ATP-binding protein